MMIFIHSILFQQFTVTEQAQVNSDVYKFDTSGKLGKNTGSAKVKILVPHQEPVVLEAHYNADVESEYAASHTNTVEIKKYLEIM